LKTGVAHRLDARHHTVLHEGVHAARILRRHVRFQIQLSDFAAEVRRKVGGIESFDGRDAAAPCEDGGPSSRDVVAYRRDDSKTRNDDTPFAQYQPLART